MCGIIGFVGENQALPILLDGLKRMEYRGYDSAGVAVRCDDGALQIVKSNGRLDSLKATLENMPEVKGHMGIGHTRWATHGEPSNENAHPHISGDGKIALVHNGIIENYQEVKDMLIQKGYEFTSDTDSEVAAKLLGFYYNLSHDILDAVSELLHHLSGSYALGIICSDYPNSLIAAKKDSPLLLGYGENGCMIASDATAIIPQTRRVSYMEDGEVAIVSKDSIKVFSGELVPVEKEISTIDWDIASVEKSGYPHFMLKEIMEQPEALRKTTSPRIKGEEIVFEGLDLSLEKLKSFKKIFILACGSSFHVGMVCKYNYEKLLRIPVEVVLASEFRYSDPLVDENTLVIVISQSGETLDTLVAMREAKRRGAETLSIVNVVGSSIARDSDHVLYTWAGPEISVATTKGYSSQLFLLDLFCLYMAHELESIPQEEYLNILHEIQILPDKMDEILKDTTEIQYLASLYFNRNSIFFIGRNLDYAVGLEGSLKLKEISYIHSEAYAAGELKHGTISLIEEGTLVVSIACYEALIEKAVSNMMEVAARGAQVLSLTTNGNAQALKNSSSHTLVIPKTHTMLQPSLSIIPLQLFSYYVALQRGCDIDKPRNLAKSVTVE